MGKPKKARGGKIVPKPREGRVCKPAVTKLPTSLQILPCEEGIPQELQGALGEFRNLQTYFSALERIAPEVATHSRMNTCWMGLPSAEIKSFERPDSEDGFTATLRTADAEHTVFIKRVHVLDPLACIEGECVWPTEGSLPAPAELWMTALEKLNDPMNEAYVDAVFAMLADRMAAADLSPHWLRCFGTFPARVEKYAYNISEEYSSLRRKTFWSRHQNLGLFQLYKEEAKDCGSRRAREPLAVEFSEGVEIGDGDFEVTEVPQGSADAAVEVTEGSDSIEAEDVPMTLNEPLVRIRRIEGSDTSSSSASSESDDGMEYYAEFTDFPVQVTLLEKAEGTLDELMDEESTDPTKWTAWMFQIIAALSAAQHWFGFVHNDLHTNNVMWVRTDREHLNYCIHGKGGKKTYYRVPTYGYIMKIIDFGRASFHLPEPAGFFISDAFFPGNDAGEQYNCEPFFDPKAGKKVEPNPSFDLCRLAVSLLEALFPTRPPNATPIEIMSREGPKTYAKTTSALYNLMWEWLTDDEGKNILREPNGRERYPNFDLYSAIAADVHRAVPSQQLEKPLFAGYTVPKPEAPTYDLWL